MDTYVIAKYIRLSMDDTYSDSISIENQRLILDSHIAGMDMPGEEAEVLEFLDNGYSGTNFERPGIQNLLEQARSGIINCIIVKDFSRFGRNAIETGYYIERMFPLCRVRFISVNDGFDSDSYKGTTGGLDVAFTFLIHEQYSKDLSRKIKSAKHERMRRGEYLTKKCAFGYKKAGDRLEPDEPAASYVRHIFALALEYDTYAKIARRLHQDRIPTPDEYRRLNTISSRAKAGESRGAGKSPAFSCVWQSDAVRSVLHDEQYTGTYVVGKTRVIDVCSRKTVKVDQSEWIRIPNRHVAIVDRQIFDAVGGRFEKRRAPAGTATRSTAQRAKRHDTPLKGKVICGACGHKMQLSVSQNPVFRCVFSSTAPEAPCHRLSTPLLPLREIVLGRIRELTERDCISKSGQTAEQEQSRIYARKQALYELFVSGAITDVSLRLEYKGLDEELSRLKAAVPVTRNVSARNSSYEKLKNEVMGLAKHCAATGTLSRELADRLIDSIIVHPDGHTELRYLEPWCNS